LLDFSPAAKSETVIPYQGFQISRSQMESLARNLQLFSKNILRSKNLWYMFCYDGQVFFANSEGTSVQYPLQIESVKVVATTQAQR